LLLVTSARVVACYFSPSCCLLLQPELLLVTSARIVACYFSPSCCLLLQPELLLVTSGPSTKLCARVPLHHPPPLLIVVSARTNKRHHHHHPLHHPPSLLADSFVIDPADITTTLPKSADTTEADAFLTCFYRHVPIGTTPGPHAELLLY